MSKPPYGEQLFAQSLYMCYNSLKVWKKISEESSTRISNFKLLVTHIEIS